MKKNILIIVLCLFGKWSYSFNDTSLIYRKAYNYLISSKKIEKKIMRLCKTAVELNCDNKKNLIYLCSNLQFINLFEYKNKLLSSPYSLSINKSDLQSRIIYKDKFFFQPYADSSMRSGIVEKDGIYCSYMTFSRLNGNVLPFIVYQNDDLNSRSPCDQLSSIKFGKALVGLIVFDITLSKVETVLLEDVIMN